MAYQLYEKYKLRYMYIYQLKWLLEPNKSLNDKNNSMIWQYIKFQETQLIKKINKLKIIFYKIRKNWNEYKEIVLRVMRRT